MSWPMKLSNKKGHNDKHKRVSKSDGVLKGPTEDSEDDSSNRDTNNESTSSEEINKHKNKHLQVMLRLNNGGDSDPEHHKVPAKDAIKEETKEDDLVGSTPPKEKTMPKKSDKHGKKGKDSKKDKKPDSETDDEEKDAKGKKQRKLPNKIEVVGKKGGNKSIFSERLEERREHKKHTDEKRDAAEDKKAKKNKDEQKGKNGKEDKQDAEHDAKGGEEKGAEKDSNIQTKAADGKVPEKSLRAGDLKLIEESPDEKDPKDDKKEEDKKDKDEKKEEKKDEKKGKDSKKEVKKIKDSKKDNRATEDKKDKKNEPENKANDNDKDTKKKTDKKSKKLEGRSSTRGEEDIIAVDLGKDNPTIKVVHRKLADLPDNLHKQWNRLGIADAELELNVDLIFHISWFIERADFPKDFQSYERKGESPSYCSKEEIDVAKSVIAPPPKDIKKFYKAIEFFDKGGFGAVFSGKVPVGKKKGRVAIKKLPHTSERVMENNLSEIYFLSQCKHPNIVEFQQCYLVDSTFVKDKKLTTTELWIIMEFLEGGTLSEAARASNFSDDHIAYVAREILKALEYLHDKKFVHRDLKSQNVMLSIKGEVKLIDFGLAADLSAGPQTKMLGSPFWIPPEMIRLQPHDQAADIWSFAVCILEFYLMSPPIYHSSMMCMYTAATKGLAHLIPEEATSFAKNFLQKCLVVDQTSRTSTKELLKHPWVTRPNLFDGIPAVLRQIFLCHNLGSLGFV